MYQDFNECFWLEIYINKIIFLDFCFKLFFKYRLLLFFFFFSVIFLYKEKLNDFFFFSKIFRKFRDNVFFDNKILFLLSKKFYLKKRKIQNFLNYGYFFSNNYNLYLFLNFFFFNIINLMLYYKHLFLLNFMKNGFLIKWHDVYTRYYELSNVNNNNNSFFFKLDTPKLNYNLYFFSNIIYFYFFIIFFSFFTFFFFDKKSLLQIFSRFFFFLRIL